MSSTLAPESQGYHASTSKSSTSYGLQQPITLAPLRKTIVYGPSTTCVVSQTRADMKGRLGGWLLLVGIKCVCTTYGHFWHWMNTATGGTVRQGPRGGYSLVGLETEVAMAFSVNQPRACGAEVRKCRCDEARAATSLFEAREKAYRQA
jgi:hypothetical protein